MRKSLLVVLISGLLVLTGAGCRFLDTPADSDVGELPWNTPAGWEGQILGLPY